MKIMKITLAFVLCAFIVYAQKSNVLRNAKVLVYTRNGKGYVHDNITHAVSCIKKLGDTHNFQVSSTDDPQVFTEENLKQYRLIIFPSTNNDVFDTNEQRLAFRRYIEAGGGFVGLHSVMGTERNWKWFKMMLGGTFAWHATFQTYTVKVIAKSHPSISGVPHSWLRSDECYFAKELYPGTQTLLVHDLKTLNPKTEEEREKIKTFSGWYPDYYAAAWLHLFDGGKIWVTALGHDKKDYEDPTFINHIFQGIQYVASQTKKLDYSKAYANTYEDEVKY